ncbi:PREDICTED: cathepsin G isoform X1 [Capra hircus]|uniref:Peptidase S1 domain-containing protein n=1 Tax=Capra hircus TaxID=9925 RepID=A0A452DVX7_CAPHI|nr:PREDICTED: cathepsin G isoform X1 [Capra hircus]
MRPLLLLMAFLLSPRARAGQIIGGREARPHSRPYMAYIQTLTPAGLTICGGFLVREDFVMTAARCLGSQINVILGIHSVTASEWTQQRIPVLRPIPHPRYDQRNNRNDIMLLQLAYRVRQNEAVRLVALPQTEEMLSPGTQCTVAGWGLTGQNRRAITLQEVQLTIQRDGECHSRFDFYTGQKQICVGDPRERKSTFLGDSGGPLVCSNVAQGIVSYGDRVGTPPAVFTRISSFLPWIRRTMRRFQEWTPE